MQAELRELLDKQAITELLYAYADGPMRTDRSPRQQAAGEGIHRRLQLHYGAYDHPASVLIKSWRADSPPAFLMTHHLSVP